MLEKNIKSFIDELIKEVEDELDEANVTGNVDGYDTPNAFSGKNSDKKRKKTATQFGYTLVNNDINNIDESVNEATNDKKRFMFDFYTDSNQRNTERETNFLATTLESAIKAAEHICKVTGYAYVEIYYKDLFLGSMKKQNGFKFVEGRGYPKFKSTNEAILNEDTKRVNILGIDFNISEMNGRIFFSFIDKKAASIKIREIVTNKIVNLIQNSLDKAYGKGEFFFKGGDHAEFQNGYLFQRSIGNIKLNKLKFEALDPKAEKFLDAIKVNDRSIKDLKNITVDATPQGNWSVYYKGKRMFTLNGKMLDDKTIMKYGLEHMDESLSEGKKIHRPVNRWLELKNDESMHANKKLATGLRELKYQLKEVETFFRWYNQIKTMNELSSDTFWKRTHGHIYKIKERLINIAKTIQEIEK